MKPLSPKAVIAWLGAARFEKLGDTREASLADVITRAPNVPTAGIWTLQACGIVPSAEDLSKWSTAVAKLSES